MAKINSRISLLRPYAMNDKKINFDKLQQLNDEELESWWQAVPGARHFLNAIVEATDKHCATAAHLPKNLTKHQVSSSCRSKVKRYRTPS